MSWSPDDLSGFALPGYRLVRQLGQGGMATVYLAVQESVHREVALKVMSPFLASDGSFTERFLREARIAAQLHHPNIVTVHDVGVHESWHYIAMQYLPGGKLSDRKLQQLPVSEALTIVRDIAQALAYAHEKGFVHRDVKPDNILFDEKGASCLTDFGIARAADSNTQMTATGSIIGTPHYMSPEQARGRRVDHRADLYSLGIVLYQLLTGEVPYQSEESLTVCIMHVNDPLPRLPRCLAVLQPVLDRLLAKEPEERFADAQALIQALDSLQQQGRLDDCLHYTPDTLPHVVENTTRKNTPEIRPTPRPAQRADTRRKPPHRSGGRWWIWALPVMLISVLALLGQQLYRQWQAEQDAVREQVRLSQQQAHLNWLLEQQRFHRPAGDNAVEWLRQMKQRGVEPDRLKVLTRKVLQQWLKALQTQPDHGAVEAWMALAREMGLEQGTLVMQARGLLEPGPAEVAASSARSEQPAAQLQAEADAWLRQVEAMVGEDFHQLVRAWTLLQQPPPAANESRLKVLRQHVVDRLRKQLQNALERQALDMLELRLDRLQDLPALYQHLDGAWWQQQLRDQRSASEQQALLQQRIDQLLREGQEFLARDRLTRPAGSNALERFEQVLALDPENARARDGMGRLVRRLLQLAQSALDEGDSARAARHLKHARTLMPDDPQVQQLAEKLAAHKEKTRNLIKGKAQEWAVPLPETVDALLAFAQSNKRKQPELAIRAWRRVLDLQPEHEQARRALERMAAALALDAEFLLDEGDLKEAGQRMQWALQAAPDHPEVRAVQRKYRRANKKSGGADAGPLLELQTTAQLQRLESQAGQIRTVTDAESLWREAERLPEQYRTRVRSALLQQARLRVQRALRKQQLEQAGNWLDWLEAKPEAVHLARPLRAQWQTEIHDGDRN